MIVSRVSAMTAPTMHVRRDDDDREERRRGAPARARPTGVVGRTRAASRTVAPSTASRYRPTIATTMTTSPRGRRGSAARRPGRPGRAPSRTTTTATTARTRIGANRSAARRRRPRSRWPRPGTIAAADDRQPGRPDVRGWPAGSAARRSTGRLDGLRSSRLGSRGAASASGVGQEPAAVEVGVGSGSVVADQLVRSGCASGRPASRRLRRPIGAVTSRRLDDSGPASSA